MIKEIKPNFDGLQDPETIIQEVEKATNEVDEVSTLKTVLDNLEIKATDEIEPPRVVWEQINGTETAILGTLGNFSLIIGKGLILFRCASTKLDILNFSIYLA